MKHRKNGKQVVLVDCDGVLGNFKEAYLRDFHLYTSIRVLPEEVVTLKMEDSPFFKKALETYPGLTKKMHDNVSAKGWCYNIRPYPGTHEAIRELKSFAQVVCLTAPWMSDFWMPERRDWLWDHFGISHQDVHFTSSKYLVHGDFLIEDNHHLLAEWKNVNDGIPVLFSRSYNKEAVVGRDTLRTDNWEEIVQMVRNKHHIDRSLGGIV